MPRVFWIVALVALVAPACSDNPSGPATDTPQQGRPAAWEWQNPLPQGNYYLGVEALADGRVATITQFEALVTDDGGVTWGPLHTGGDYRDLYRRGSLLAILTDDRVVVTTDNGGSWRATAPHGISGWAVAFHDADHGIVVGFNGEIAKTDDGGDSWTPRPSGTLQTLYDVDYLDEDKVLVPTDNRVLLRSNDGGTTWSNPPPTPFSGDLRAIDITAGIVRITGNAGEVFVSTDEGQNWAGYDVETGEDLTDIDFIDASVGIVVGDDGFVARSDDGGITWNELSPASANALSDGACLDASELWVAGEAGEIYRTTNGGGTWSLLLEGWKNDLLDVAFADANTGVAVGRVLMQSPTITSCGVLYTHDGGWTWNRAQVGSSSKRCQARDLYAVCMIDAMHAVAVGVLGDIWASEDGGVTWAQRDAGIGDVLQDVDFADAAHGIAVGADGRTLVTTDGGLNWSAGNADTQDELMGVSMATPDIAIAVGRDGLARKTDDGGQSWTDVGADLSGFELSDVVMLDEMTAVAVGYGSVFGAAFLTTDGGASWEPQQPPLEDAFGARLSFASNTHGYITVYGNPYMYATTDGGPVYFMQDGGETLATPERERLEPPAPGS